MDLLIVFQKMFVVLQAENGHGWSKLLCGTV